MGLRKIKNILIILVAALLLSAVSLVIIGNVGNEEKTSLSAVDTITDIYSLNDLKTFRDSVDAGVNYWNSTIYLHDDIDMLNINWDGIGYYDDAFLGSDHKLFAGTFDGQGHTLYNYTGDSGIFSYNSGVIKNLNVITSSSGASQGIVDCNVSSIINCSIKGTINAKTDKVGGIAGDMPSGKIQNCINWANINGASYSNIGGIVGRATSTAGGTSGNGPGTVVCSCINYGNITGKNEIGGLVGRYHDDKIIPSIQAFNSINLGKVSGTGEYIGGVAGRNYHNSAQFYRCYNASSSGVKGAGVGGSKVGKDFTDGDFYCATTSDLNTAAGVRRYASDSSKWDTNKEWYSNNTWFCDSTNSYWSNISSLNSTNNGYPYLKSSALTVTVNVNDTSYGYSGSFEIIKGDSIASSGSSIRVNSSYTIYTASPKSSTNQYTYSFSSWSGIPSGAQYANVAYRQVLSMLIFQLLPISLGHLGSIPYTLM